MAAGNITCIIAAACLAYLPTHMQWNRLVAFWFTAFQVRLEHHWIIIMIVYTCFSLLASPYPS